MFCGCSLLVKIDGESVTCPTPVPPRVIDGGPLPPVTIAGTDGEGSVGQSVGALLGVRRRTSQTLEQRGLLQRDQGLVDQGLG